MVSQIQVVMDVDTYHDTSFTADSSIVSNICGYVLVCNLDIVLYHVLNLAHKRSDR